MKIGGIPSLAQTVNRCSVCNCLLLKASRDENEGGRSFQALSVNIIVHESVRVIGCEKATALFPRRLRNIYRTLMLNLYLLHCKI